MSTVSGITEDALAQLPLQGDLETFEERCQRIFIVYLQNLKLLNDNPEKYHALADREWLRRNIILRASDLKALTTGNPLLTQQIEASKRIALQALDCGENRQQLEKQVNAAFELIFERIPKKKLGGTPS